MPIFSWGVKFNASSVHEACARVTVHALEWMLLYEVLFGLTEDV
jgi:hypothetical protein